MFRNRCYDRPMAFAESNNFMAQQDMNVEYPVAMPMMGNTCGCDMPPVQECPQERVCHREFVHNVPQV